MHRLRSLYSRTLTTALRHRGKVLLFAVVFFVASLFLMPLLRKEMIPSHDISRFLVRIQTPPGSSLAATDKVMKTAEAFLEKRSELDIYFTIVGGTGGGSDVNTGIVFVTLKKPHDRPKDKTLGRRLTLKDFMELCGGGRSERFPARHIDPRARLEQTGRVINGTHVPA